MTLKDNIRSAYTLLHQTNATLKEVKQALHWREFLSCLKRKIFHPTPRGDYRGKS